MSMLIVGTIILATALLLALFTWQRNKKQRHLYPPNLPSPTDPTKDAGFFETVAGLTGNEAPFFIYKALQGLKGKKWMAKMNLPVNSRPSYCVADHDLAKEILTDSLTVKPKAYDEFDFVSNGPSIVSANGWRWKHVRKCVAPAFSVNHVKRMNNICEKQLGFWKKNTLEPLAESGGSFDVCEEMVHLTMSIICEAAFDYHMSRQEMTLFTTNLEIATREFIIMNPLHRTLPFLFPQVWKAKRAAKVIQRIAYNVMDHYRNSTNDSPDNVLSRIMNNSNYRNDEERAADVVTFLAAGHDTTAYSIAWTLLEIARCQPQELDLYRKQANSLANQADWRRVDELQYMIKEAMRLYPVAAMGSSRQVGRDFCYKDVDGPKLIPKGSWTWVMFLPLFRNSYKDNADKFLPSRWACPDITQALIMPFSMGARNCVGQSLAMAELQTVLAVLLQEYDFIVENEGTADFFLTLKPMGARLIPKKL